MSTSPAPLVLTGDPALVEILERLAAAAGVSLEVRPTRPARAAWLVAGLVLAGTDLASGLAAAMPRRGRVLLVGLDPDGALATSGDGALWRAAVELGAERVALLPQDQDWVVQALAEEPAGARRCAVVGVAGGCGGAGASVLAAAVALRAAGQGRRTLLADLDPLGGGVDLLVGAEQAPGLRWPELALARGRVSGGMLREALPRVDGRSALSLLSLLSWDRSEVLHIPAEAAAAVAVAAFSGFDVVVADVGRTGNPMGGTWLRRIDLGLVVVPANVRAAAAAGRVLAWLDPTVTDLRIIVRGPSPGRLPAGRVADSLGRPRFAELRPEPGLAAMLERAEPPGLRARGPLARCAARVLDALDAVEPAA